MLTRLDALGQTLNMQGKGLDLQVQRLVK